MADATYADTPRDHVPPELKEKALRLDVADCSMFAIYMKIGEFEKAGGLRFDQWPEAIRARMEKEILDWQERNPNAVIKAVTQAIEQGICILALHWRLKR